MNNICNLEQLSKLRDNEPKEADNLICKLLTDEEVNCKDMFENLVTAYLKGSDEFRQGIDKACEILLWKNVQEIADMAEQLLTEEEKEEGKE